MDRYTVPNNGSHASAAPEFDRDRLVDERATGAAVGLGTDRPSTPSSAPRRPYTAGIERRRRDHQPPGRLLAGVVRAELPHRRTQVGLLLVEYKLSGERANPATGTSRPWCRRRSPGRPSTTCSSRMLRTSEVPAPRWCSPGRAGTAAGSAWRAGRRPRRDISRCAAVVPSGMPKARIGVAPFADSAGSVRHPTICRSTPPARAAGGGQCPQSAPEVSRWASASQPQLAGQLVPQHRRGRSRPGRSQPNHGRRWLRPALAAGCFFALPPQRAGSSPISCRHHVTRQPPPSPTALSRCARPGCGRPRSRLLNWIRLVICREAGGPRRLRVST